MLGLAPNWVRFDTYYGTNLGLIKVNFLFILAQRAKMNRKLILKSPRFVPFGANLTTFRVKPDTPLRERKSCFVSKQKGLSRAVRTVYIPKRGQMKEI